MSSSPHAGPSKLLVEDSAVQNPGYIRNHYGMPLLVCCITLTQATWNSRLSARAWVEKWFAHRFEYIGGTLQLDTSGRPLRFAMVGEGISRRLLTGQWVVSSVGW